MDKRVWLVDVPTMTRHHKPLLAELVEWLLGTKPGLTTIGFSFSSDVPKLLALRKDGDEPAFSSCYSNTFGLGCRGEPAWIDVQNEALQRSQSRSPPGLKQVAHTA